MEKLRTGGQNLIFPNVCRPNRFNNLFFPQRVFSDYFFYSLYFIRASDSALMLLRAPVGAPSIWAPKY